MSNTTNELRILMFFVYLVHIISNIIVFYCYKRVYLQIFKNIFHTGKGQINWILLSPKIRILGVKDVERGRRI